MARLIYNLAPLENAMMTDFPSLQIPGTFSPWVQNVNVDQHSIQKRWGYYRDRDFGPGRLVLNIAIYQMMNGGRYCMLLTDTDLAIRKTGVGETFQYVTQTFTTKHVDSMNVAQTIITAHAGTNWNAATAVAAGDKFIMDADHSSAVEVDTNWATISSVSGADEITLTSAYTGLTTSGNYKIRKVYATPTNERWTYATVGDKFCFTNGLTNVQYWAGAGYATDLDATNAIKARYCVEYANRLFLADITNPDTSLRDPLMIKWSKEGDPTDWVDSSAGSAAMLDTDDYITGLGKVGSYLVVYKRNALYFFGQTGNPVFPIASSPDLRRVGIGNIAPYSIVEVLGTNVFLGQDDFYKIEGTEAVEISHKAIRQTFFDMVSVTERTNVWGLANYDAHEVMWIANTTSGQYAFVWNYVHDQWYVYQFRHNITGAGKGSV